MASSRSSRGRPSARSLSAGIASLRWMTALWPPGTAASLREHGRGGAEGTRGSPGRGLRRRVQPGLEERREVLSGDPLGEVDELLGRRVALGVLSGPVAQDAEERLVADLLAQGLERHPAAAIDRAREHRVALRV